MESVRDSEKVRPEDQPAIELGPVQESDYPFVYKWWSDASELHLWSAMRRPFTYGQFVKEIEQRMLTTIFIVVRLVDTGTPIGFFQLYDIVEEDGVAGYLNYLDREWRNTGYSQLSHSLFLSFAFRTFPLRRIIGDVYEYHEDSVRRVMRAGFVEEGRLKKHLWWRDRYWDHIKVAITRERLQELGRLMHFASPRDEQGNPLELTDPAAQRQFLSILDVGRSPRDPEAGESAAPPAPIPPAATSDLDLSGVTLGMLSTEQDIEDFVDLVFDNRDWFQGEWSLPYLQGRGRDGVRLFVAPPHHQFYGLRDKSGRLLSAMAYRHDSDEKETRIWAWAIDPNLAYGQRVEAGRRLIAGFAEAVRSSGSRRCYVALAERCNAARLAQDVLQDDAPERVQGGRHMLLRISADLGKE